MKLVSILSLAATFEGEFSPVTRSCGATGVARYAWQRGLVYRTVTPPV
jgi:hypothetical protein